jgi:hypothetical protein
MIKIEVMSVRFAIILYTLLRSSSCVILLSLLLVSCGMPRTEKGCTDTAEKKENMMTKELPAPAGTEMATFGMG